MLTTARILGHPIVQEDLLKFAKRYKSKDKHWIWTGSVDQCGLGRFWIGSRKARRLVKARRFSYAIKNRCDDIDDIVIYTTCEEKRCVNPDHLQASPVKAKWARGKNHKSRTAPHSVPRGEQHPRSKLNEELVIRIRHWLDGGFAVDQIQDKLRKIGVNVTRSCIYNVIDGRTWKDA